MRWRRPTWLGSVALIAVVFGACTADHDDFPLAETSDPVEVTVDALSGLPNPAWVLDSASWSRLQREWSNLEPTTAAEYPDVLGYRGIIVDLGDGRRMTVARQIVTLTDGVTVTARRDPDRVLERWLLETGLADADADTRNLIRSILGAFGDG